jgi:hypothetical protein
MTDQPVRDPKLEDEFYKRADDIIALANKMADTAERGRVGGSLMFASTRFNCWISATGFRNAEEMAAKRTETVAYFLEGYRQMLELNFDQYVENFDAYMKPKG